MNVTGFFNPSHVIRLFLAKEYSFDIRYPKHTVRIGHHKGQWSIGKIRNGTLIDHVIVYDYGSGLESENEMTKALFEKIMDDTWEKVKKNYTEEQGPNRQDDALGIETALLIWGGKVSDIGGIDVVQPGRNGLVDEVSGEYRLSPRPEEFSK